MCDVAYLCQIEALERESLAQIALLPHMEEKDRRNLSSPEQVRSEFDDWLMSVPDEVTMTAEDHETAALYRLLGVGKG